MSEYNTQTYDKRQAVIEAAREAFLAAGGAIQVFVSGQDPQLYRRPASQNTFVPEITETIHSKLAGAADSPERGELVGKIRKMAKTLNRQQIAAELGISRLLLRQLGKVHSIEFVSVVLAQKAAHIDTLRDAAYVLQIKECMQDGLSQKRAQARIGISNTLFSRLIADYKIDYPRGKPGGKWLP
ncbi:DNA binding protein [Pseudomonas phage AH02]|nr:DNA binding protein [Pseudomonas phage AH02]